jgi:hypothetical protein
MNSKSEKEVDTQEVKQAVRSAIERGESIREDVRNITLNALSKGKLDVKKINQVVRAVMEGASRDGPGSCKISRGIQAGG